MMHSEGNHNSGILLTIKCPCGQQHEIELDSSGHWKGRCDSMPAGQFIEVQLRPNEWREIIETQQAKAVH